MENPSRTSASKVVRPPFRTAGPGLKIVYQRYIMIMFWVVKVLSTFSKPLYDYKGSPIVATALPALSAVLPEDAK